MAIENVKITTSTAPLFAAFKSLYDISFPEFEQRTPAQQEVAFAQEHYHLLAYTENDTFIGL